MWEKEVTVKYKLPFAAKWSAQFGTQLINQKQDGREDDGVLTPKKSEKKEKVEERPSLTRKSLSLELSSVNRGNINFDRSTVTLPKQAVERVDMFQNQEHNLISNFPHFQYEENEAVPPRLDKFAGKDALNKNGQFLVKHYVPLPEDAKRWEKF